ncbi:MAG: hypothetical protein KAI66_23575 [Lentisphaeria bacterium]|nr:hypothetical protein [Lentisphaeria bacterium]
MRKRIFQICAMTMLIVAATCAGAETLSLPICCGEAFVRMELAPAGGVRATLKRTEKKPGITPSAEISFEKEGAERRLIALATIPRSPLPAFKAAEIECRLTVDEGMSVRPAIVLYDDTGGSWCHVGDLTTPTTDFQTLRFAVLNPRATIFSEKGADEFQWERVTCLWIGFVVDGAGKGTASISSLKLTSEPFHPTEPIEVLRAVEGAWSISADKAVTKTQSLIKDEKGVPCVRFEFAFPGGRHMYLVPRQSITEREYASYAMLRIEYKATLPAGIGGLLVSVFENGGQFIAPPPKATGKWETVDIPLSSFKLPSWSKDNNGVLEPSRVGAVGIGAHGTAAGKGGKGEILLRRIAFVPAAK